MLNLNEMNRFGKNSSADIDLKPLNTTKTENYIWKQFQEFCEQRNYELTGWTSNDELGNILKDWAFNMKRKDGSDYKEGVVKTMERECQASTRTILQKPQSKNRSFQRFGI